MSAVWEYARKSKNPFTKEIEGICGQCGKSIKCSGGSTTSLKTHLQSKHGIMLSTSDAGEVFDRKKMKIVSERVARKNSKKEIVSDMATDGISIRAITKNGFIRKWMSSDGIELPEEEAKVMSLVIEDYNDKKKLMVREIKRSIDKERKFGLTLDEYKTGRRRRYLGINLHDYHEKKTYKTGMIRVNGAYDAEIISEMVGSHLSSFGINIETDIAGATHDNGLVSKKLMNHLSIIEQSCINYSIHLGVCDTFYKKHKIIEDDSTDSESQGEDEFSIAPDAAIAYDDDESDISSIEILNSARNVVKFIKKSTARYQIFQSKVKAEYGREIELNMDTRNRWDSIILMLDPLVRTKKILIDIFGGLNAQHVIDDVDFTVLSNLRLSLESIKLAVEVLNRNDATLLKAETVIDFMLNKLQKFGNEISSQLYNNIKARLDGRMNNNVLELMKSLDDPNHKPTENSIVLAGTIANRLFGVVENDMDISNDATSESADMTLEEELHFMLSKSSQSHSSTKFMSIRQDFIMFKKTGKCTENLQKIYEALLSVKPASTAIERVFSINSSSSTIIRSKLSDDSLNALIFLKFYYNKK